MAQNRLNLVLVMPDSNTMPGWIARLVERIGDAEFLDARAVVLARPAKKHDGGLVFGLVRRLELASGAGRAPAAAQPSRHLLDQIPPIAPGDYQALADCHADVILDLTDGYGTAAPASAARLGVWFTDVCAPIQGLAGLRPLLDGGAISPINLFRRIDGQAEPEAIASAAVNTKFMAARNQAFIEEKSVALILRELKRAALNLPRSEPDITRHFAAPNPPKTMEALAYSGRMVGELAQRTWQKLSEKRGLRPGMFNLNLARGDPLTFDPAVAASVNPQGNCYHADPFLWQRGVEQWCFFETYDYSTATGHISAGRLDDGHVKDIRTVLKPGYHLSFPFLFEYGGYLFMMPESCAKQRIELWRCTGFPDYWELHTTALEGVLCSDSTLAEIDGQWWLFTNIGDDPYGDQSSELHLFRADSPMLGKLEPHPLNPVVFDSRHARNGGRIWRHNGAHYRPAQDNSHGTYGYGLNLMRIDELSMTNYRETSARHLAPTFLPGLIGCHHIDRIGDSIVFDVRHRQGGRG